MDKIFTYFLALAVCMGTTVLLSNNRHYQPPSQLTDSQMAVDGAFRDGLYVGRLAAEAGRPSHPLIGRWSTDRDRTWFVAGYRRGYNDVLLSASLANGRRSE